jgi:hypothetical protein
MMTKKDFVRFAEDLAKVNDDMVRKTLIQRDIKLLKETNPRFDEKRFEEYVEKKARMFK